MKKLSLCVPLTVIGLASAAIGQDWSAFRGAAAQGMAVADALPATFSAKTERWRVPVGGKGYSSPVLWKGSVLLTRVTAHPKEGDPECEVVSFDAQTGAEQWARGFEVGAHRMHNFNSPSSSTLAVDARGIYVVFSSGSDLEAMALDHGGKQRWRRRVGSFATQHGGGSSPVVVDGVLLVVNVNERGDSALHGLETASGETRWKLPRKTVAKMTPYATPVLVPKESGGPYALFASTTHGLTAVDPKKGEVLWELDVGFKSRVVGTPALAGDRVFLSGGSGGGGKDCALVKLPSESGQKPEVVHRPRRNLPYVPSAQACEDLLFMFSDGGIASCLLAESGEVAWKQRLAGTFFSSPVSNGKAVYIVSRDGKLFSLAVSERFELLDEFELGEPAFATPAIGGDCLFVRTESQLICLGKPDGDS